MEHIFFDVDDTGIYEIWVHQSGPVVVPADAIDPFGHHQRYGLAWWAGTAVTLTGDFDGDGNVDGADLAEWRGDFGIDNGSDADNDGDSDGADFLVWQRQLGSMSATPAAGAVPEPATWLLGIAGALSLTRDRSKK